ncbi:MAG: response regulator [Verrucomicrobiota bacterium]
MKDFLHSLLDPLSISQDYLWFVCILIWGYTALIRSARRPGKFLPDWYFQMSLAVSVLAVVTVIRQIFPPENVVNPPIIFECSSKVAMGLALVALARPTLGTKAWIVWIVLASGLTWDIAQPAVPGERSPIAFGISSIIACIALLPKTLTSKAPGLGLKYLAIFSAIAVSLSPDGVLAELTDETRRWTELSLFNLPFAVAWIAAGISFYRIQISDLSDSSTKALLPELKPLSICLILGFALAYVAGLQARLSFENGLLARSKAYAHSLDRETLRPWVKNRFSLINPEEHYNYIGPISTYHTPALLDPEIQNIRKYYQEIEGSDSDIAFAHFATIKDNELVSAILPIDEGFETEIYNIRHRIVNTTDLDALTNPTEFVRGPETLPWGSLVGAWVPVFSKENEVLGWSVIHTTSSKWLSVQAQSRLQILAVVGVSIAVIILLQRNRERQKLAKEAEQQAFLEARAHASKTSLLAQVSHELRTPIQSIIGYAELMLTDQITETHAHWIRSQQSHSRQLLRLVDDLIDASTLESGKFNFAPERTTIKNTFQASLISHEKTARSKNIEFLQHFPNDDKHVFWDPTRVCQICDNIIANAIKYTDHGQVEVSLALNDEPNGVQTSILNVKDTGAGIPKEKQQTMFEPFERLRDHEHKDGAGLGLFIARSLCKSMQGEIHIRSEIGIGTTMTAIWQTKAPEACDITQIEVPTSPAHSQKPLENRRILVAEDNEIVVGLLKQILESNGAYVDSVRNGQDAVAMLMDRAYDLAILDISMPSLSGLEVTQKIREADKSLRIVGLSAHAQEKEKQKALAFGMDAFLSKPVSIEDLINAATGFEVTLPAAENSSTAESARDQFKGKFLTEALVTTRELFEDLSDQNWESLCYKSHYTKGAAALLDMETIAQHCDRINRASESQSFANVNDAIHSLQQHLKSSNNK